MKPNFLTRLNIAYSIFKRGFPVERFKAANGNSLFSWPTWRSTVPQWQTVDFLSYVEEGFNTNPLVYSALMYKARAKMSAPLRAYSGDPENPDRLKPSHPLAKLVTRPNPYQAWSEFQALAEIYFNLGNCFIFFFRPKSGGLPEKMYTLRPDRVFIIPGEDDIKGYLYVPEARSIRDGVPILPEDMMHVKLPNPSDPFEGMGFGMPPTSIGRSIDVDNEITRFLKIFFQNGAMPLGILKFNTPLDEDEIPIIKQRWKEMYGGVDNWTDIGVLDHGGEYQRIGANFDEMGFEAIDERNESRILGPLGVPPILIGTRTGLSRSTYSNYEQARLAFWEDTAIPELQLFESEWQYYLSTEDGGFVAYDLTKVPALIKSRVAMVNAAYAMWQMGTPANVAFSTVGLSVPDLQAGDISFIPTSVTPVGVDREDDQTMVGAVDAEDDPRKSTLPGSSPNSHSPNRVNITCPLCQCPAVDRYDDHGGVCLCPDCLNTFDPQAFTKFEQVSENLLSKEKDESDDRTREELDRSILDDIQKVIGNANGFARLRDISDESWARAEQQERTGLANGR